MNIPTKPRTIRITPVLNGFLVEVGCQFVVTKTADELGTQIAAYYKNPQEVEALFIKGRVNNTIDQGPLCSDDNPLTRGPARPFSPISRGPAPTCNAEAIPNPAYAEPATMPMAADVMAQTGPR